MKANNNEFVIDTIDESKLIVDTGERGQFVFTIDNDNEVMNFVSPISGVYQYVFDEETGEWLNSLDGHDIRGMITRDLIKHFKGCPSW